MWCRRLLSYPFVQGQRSASRARSALAQLNRVLEAELEGIRGAGTWKSERVITSKQGPHIQVQGSKGGILNFCANNYLGLSSHPEVIRSGLDALEKFGAGLSSVRFICGTQNIHKELEEKIARFHQREDAILYASCFDANAGIFEALLTPEDAVLSDELNHASIIDGIRLCKANKYRYKHMDMQDLEAKLQEAQKHRLRLVATDGAFSMDGDIAPLKEICSLAQKYQALVFIDECHATGFLGPNGRGTDELLGVMDQVDIVNSTLGKALGGAAGGYTTGPKALIDLLRQRSRPYLFSNSLPPAVVGCASKALDLLLESNAIAQSMVAKTRRFRSKMAAAGFSISGNDHPICPVMLGEARLASVIADDMLERGIYVIGFSYPVVPKGKARIRVQISAVHSEDDIDRCVEAFVEVGRKHGALP
ncbi:2-amino-3-ketobutyrate coenzyme A ligase, mitochondrial [Pelodiscus sinensis]|uniref:2-amino-3-ketobutyrate coenzyme A ligase, mitochondrial n=1 Tax=Pelodiscus sinensis TaxID=13735 RepID=K7G296_PELSI|nr:2-amino-3-ketobutyrate coenzyme A ligase, mitochondrial [Pelodiscus sinensis]|eukprot:XP_006118997.1 2-amino-3-ketobutyrate coenzyme A ligase, mitochondrial [Pelodiscus sinensis]